MSRGCLAGRPYLWDIRETQLSPSGLILRIPVMCKAYASFCGMLSRELLAKPLQSSVASVFTHSLSNTQPLQWNPTINTGYKRLNYTIKFGTEYKPTKHNVVNNNFTIIHLVYLSILLSCKKFLYEINFEGCGKHSSIFILLISWLNYYYYFPQENLFILISIERERERGRERGLMD